MKNSKEQSNQNQTPVDSFEVAMINSLWFHTFFLKGDKELAEAYKKLVSILTKNQIVSETNIKDSLEEEALSLLGYFDIDRYKVNEK